MKEVIRIFKQLQYTNSKKEKETIIEQNKDNELFKKCLRFLLDGNIVTGISDKKFNKEFSVLFNMSNIKTWEECMEYFKFHYTGTDSDIMNMQVFVKAQDESDREFYQQMITKTLRLGCDAKTVNKVIPGLIPTFDLMLGMPLDKCKLNDAEWISLSRKMNGVRCAWVGNKFLSRQNKEYNGLNHIKESLLILGCENMFVDGELLYANEEGLSDSEAFQKGTGIAMSKDMDKSQLKFVVFDIMPLEEFWNGQSQLTYMHRKKELEKFNQLLIDNNITNIEIVPLLYDGIDHNKIWEWLDIAEQHDWEGIMINLDAPYECKRTKNLIKVKKFFDCDLLCTGVEEGAGRNKGTLGALVCDYKGHTINVGTGLSDDDRTRIWEDPDSIIGKIVNIKYKEETRNKAGGVSLQFPVYVGIRYDKTEPSYN